MWAEIDLIYASLALIEFGQHPTSEGLKLVKRKIAPPDTRLISDQDHRIACMVGRSDNVEYRINENAIARLVHITVININHAVPVEK